MFDDGSDSTAAVYGGQAGIVYRDHSEGSETPEAIAKRKAHQNIDLQYRIDLMNSFKLTPFWNCTLLRAMTNSLKNQLHILLLYTVYQCLAIVVIR